MSGSLSPELQSLIPLDKAWMIRMGMMDLQAGKTEVKDYLELHTSELGDDLLALLRVLDRWGGGEPLGVGESGTLYRFVQFLLWLQGSKQTVVTRGTLQTRTLHGDPKSIDYSIEQLLQLDRGTSQWASAKLLFTEADISNLESMPYHLQMSIEAKQHYKQGWRSRQDQTIQRQAEAYYLWATKGELAFTPRQAEDFPFAVTYGVLTIEEGAARWPQLRNHETDRVQEMRRLIDADTIDSPDHRVVQALAMRFPKRKVSDRSRIAVNKTWPQFWQYLELVRATSS